VTVVLLPGSHFRFADPHPDPLERPAEARGCDDSTSVPLVPR
jgi:hypothetical protein